MKGYILLFLSIFCFFSFSTTHAAGEVDSFSVVLEKETAKVGESVDLTIIALDKSGNPLKDYTGEILVFSQSDKDANFPNELSKSTYKFTTANEGKIKFENAVQFSLPGLQNVHVYDMDDNEALGIAEITINETADVKNIDIEVLSPENGVTLGSNSITVSGKTQKNYQVVIILNDSQKITTTSNAEGIFEQKVENLQNGENTIIAQVIDAEDTVVGESSKISIKINAGSPEFKSISITPVGEVEAESEIFIEVISNIGLREVQTIINDVIFTLKEEKSGVYKGKGLAPKQPGKYGVNVILKDEFAHETREQNVAVLIVNPALMAASTSTGKVIELINPSIAPVLEELDLSITGIEVTELKTKSIITWKALQDAESYNVYKKISATQMELVSNVKEPRFEVDIVGEEIKYDDFAIKAVGRTASGELVQGNLSDMTQVKTGPELYILLAFIALMLSAGVFYMKRDSLA